MTSRTLHLLTTTLLTAALGWSMVFNAAAISRAVEHNLVLALPIALAEALTFALVLVLACRATCGGGR